MNRDKRVSSEESEPGKGSPRGARKSERRRGQKASRKQDPGSGRVVALTVDSLAAGGDGVGRDAQGRVTFVPMSAPGDKLEVRLTEEKKSYARARIERIVEPASQRVEPECPYFVAERCGGCQWQHLAVASQAEAKAQIVARALRKLSARGMSIEPMMTPVAPYRWRRRARLHYARPRGAKRALVGFYAARDRRVTDVEACPQLVPALADTLTLIREHLAPHLGSRGHIDMVAGHDGHVHIAITGYCAPRRAARLVGKSGLSATIMGVALYPPSRGAASPTSRTSARSRQAPTDQAPADQAQTDPDDLVAPGPTDDEPMEWGKRSIPLEPGLRGRAELFAQASLDGNRALLEVVKRAVGELQGRRVLELFAGSGNLARVLADGVRDLALTDGRAVPWMRDLMVGDADEVLADLIDDGHYFDLVVLDPPRTGALEIMDALVDLHPTRIVYVSCDPATLARDLERLVAGGYRAEFAQPMDLMPQTAHVEVVVALSSDDADEPGGDHADEPGGDHADGPESDDASRDADRGPAH